jgi:uncharacterized protein YeaO (DUF488 family)
MLYLDTLDNFGESSTRNQFVIWHETVKGLRNILELTPAVELLQKWETKMLAWEEFQQAFKAQLREEYSKGEKSQLRRWANYCIENDVVIYSPESSGEQTYRSVLAEVINSIWEQTGKATRVVDKAAEPVNGLSKVHREAMERTADTCKYFQPPVQNGVRKSCFYCSHLDTQVFSCGKLDKLVISYEWR